MDGVIVVVVVVFNVVVVVVVVTVGALAVVVLLFLAVVVPFPAVVVGAVEVTDAVFVVTTGAITVSEPVATVVVAGVPVSVVPDVAVPSTVVVDPGNTSKSDIVVEATWDVVVVCVVTTAAPCTVVVVEPLPDSLRKNQPFAIAEVSNVTITTKIISNVAIRRMALLRCRSANFAAATSSRPGFPVSTSSIIFCATAADRISVPNNERRDRAMALKKPPL